MPTIARNTPCPCGSGKKYKLCCLAPPVPDSGSPADFDYAALYSTAIAVFQAGDLQAANQACAHIPGDAPQAIHALNLQAMIAHTERRYGDALHLCDAAIALAPDTPEFHNNRGNALQALGDANTARISFEYAIRLHPTMVEAHNNLGNLLLAQGQATEAVPVLREAIRLHPDYPEAHKNLGNALAELGRHEDAVPLYVRALDLRPGYVEALGSLGISCLALGQHEEAVGVYLEALRQNPQEAEFYCSLGDAYQALGLSLEACEAFRAAICIQPSHPRALNNLGNALQAIGDNTEAARVYERARDLEPSRAEVHNNMGRLQLLLEREEEALTSFSRAVALNPGYLTAVEGLFQTMRAQCAWEHLEEVSERYRSLIQESLSGQEAIAANPFNAFNLPLSPAEQRALVERVSAQTAAPLLPLRGTLPPAPPRQVGQRLRIGYLSADYRNHATAHLLGHLFARHDRERFEVIAYSTGPNDGSDYRQRIEQEADRFVDMHRWTPLQAASRIRLDGVDVLVDLHGHTLGSSLGVLALHPAPLQVHFLGYPGTVGKDFVDYTLVDAVTCPPEHEPTFSEPVYRLPNCYQINDRQPIDETFSRAAYGLPERGFIFCSFNATYKLTPTIFALWLRLLDRVPHSVLWLYRSNEQAERNLRAEAGRLGCPQERIIFGGTLPKAGHLARLRHADLMLDTPVINGHTTASDALWAGVPVLSILGQSFPDRVGASLLTAIGLPELIMPDLAAYEATAVRLATSPEELAALTAKLAANRLTTPLFDTPRFVRNLETAYEELWTRHLGASTPGPHQSTLA